MKKYLLLLLDIIAIISFIFSALAPYEFKLYPVPIIQLVIIGIILAIILLNYLTQIKLLYLLKYVLIFLCLFNTLWSAYYAVDMAKRLIKHGYLINYELFCFISSIIQLIIVSTHIIIDMIINRKKEINIPYSKKNVIINLCFVSIINFLFFLHLIINSYAIKYLFNLTIIPGIFCLAFMGLSILLFKKIKFNYLFIMLFIIALCFLLGGNAVLQVQLFATAEKLIYVVVAFILVLVIVIYSIVVLIFLTIMNKQKNI